MKYTIIFIFISIIAVSCSNDNDSPILIAGFDGENYGNWTQEGTAFNNNGRIYMPLQAVPENDLRSIEMYSTGEKLRVNSLKVREIESIWTK